MLTLAGCTGQRAGIGGSCRPGSVACYEGSWGEPDLEGTNGVLSYFSLLVGSRRLRGLAGSDEGARGDASVRLDVNDAVFITGAACEPYPCGRSS